MAWLYLIVAGILEVAWVVVLNYGIKNPWRGLIILALFLSVGSILMLYLAMREIPMGTSYAIWTGVGAVGAALLGMVLFQESPDPRRLICIALIVIGIIGLKFWMPPEAPLP
jgi:quaternary ammonium compound-resistance protein SugE